MTQKVMRDKQARVVRIDVMHCPCCMPGRLRVVGVLNGLHRLPAPGCCELKPTGCGPPQWGLALQTAPVK